MKVHRPTNTSKHVRKGISEAVAAVIGVSIVISMMLYILFSLVQLQTYTVRTSHSSVEHVFAGELLSLHIVEKVVDRVVYLIRNRGTVATGIESLILYNSKLNKSLLVNIDKMGASLCTLDGELVLNPGDSLYLVCPEPFYLVGFVTSSGNIVLRDPKQYSYLISQQKVVIKRFSLLNPNTTANLYDYIWGPSLHGSINTSIGLYKRLDMEGSEIYVEADLNASLLVIGNSLDGSKFNMMIIGYGESGGSIYAQDKDRGYGDIVNLGREGRIRYRIKIENLTGDITVDNAVPRLGIYPCYIDASSQCRVRIFGLANKVTVYVNKSGELPPLDAYIFRGDINNNTYIDLLFTTQDLSVGNSNSVNDIISISSSLTQPLVDSSTKPIRIIFKDVKINSTLYSSAILSLRFIYWDNSQDDISDNDNRVVFRAGIYDADIDDYVYKIELSYYELCRYRNVKPFSASYITRDFVLYIPKVSGKIYYIAVDIMDPYYRDGNRNDADILIGLEYVGIVLGARLI